MGDFVCEIHPARGLMPSLIVGNVLTRFISGELSQNPSRTRKSRIMTPDMGAITHRMQPIRIPRRIGVKPPFQFLTRIAIVSTVTGSART